MALEGGWVRAADPAVMREHIQLFLISSLGVFAIISCVILATLESVMSPQFVALLHAVERIEAKQAADSKAIADLQSHVTELQGQLVTSQEDAAALQQTLDRLNAIAPPAAQ